MNNKIKQQLTICGWKGGLTCRASNLLQSMYAKNGCLLIATSPIPGTHPSRLSGFFVINYKTKQDSVSMR